MRSLIRWTVGTIVIVHGLIHVVGAVEGFGGADVSQLTDPISTSMAVAWLVAALLVMGAGGMLLAGHRWWWAVAALAAVVSQALIVSSWAAAKAGTTANVLLAFAALYGFLANGPTSFRATSRRLADQTVRSALSAGGPSGSLVTDADLARLPLRVAGYVRAAGAVGRDHVVGFRAAISGRIRAGADKPWMQWTGEQTNTFGPEPSRVFYMDATMKGLPTDVLHTYVGPTATMRVRVASLKTVVDARGREMDQAETVTLLNDLCVMAPAALVDAPIEWTPIDEHHVSATFTNAGQTVRAVLTFDDDDELVDFVSDDRLAASPDGRIFTPTTWSTPITGYRSFDGRRLGAHGRGRWHPDDGPGFDYLEFHVDGISYLEPGAPDPDRLDAPERETK
jgi:hypothetical protein